MIIQIISPSAKVAMPIEILSNKENGEVEWEPVTVEMKKRI